MNLPPPRLFALNSVSNGSGGTLVGVIAKRTYVVRAGRCHVAEEQVPLVETPQLDSATDMLVHDMDTVLNRTQVDVIVLGKARPHGPDRTFDVRVRLGDLDRTIRVFGERRCWRDVSGRLLFSDPAPVDAVDVGWTSAYGGVDEAALEKAGDPMEPFFRSQGVAYRPRFGSYAYPRNRAGKGYLIETTDDALDRCRLPNLEDPAHLLTPDRLAVGRPDRWPAGPLPACFGWQAYNYFPRMAMLSLVPHFDVTRFPPSSFAEVLAGLLRPASVTPKTEATERLDAGAAQQSALGMRASHVLPGSRFELTRLHQDQSVWASAIPAEVPLMAIEIPGKPSVELAPRIRTVLFEPDRGRIQVVWVGEHAEEVPIGPGKASKTRFFAQWVR